MKNPWEDISLADYENHMSDEGVMQLQTLESITGEQLDCFDVKSTAFLGAAGGNGLSRVDTGKIKELYAIDINQEYLDACAERYRGLKCLKTIKADLSDISAMLPKAELVIADLFIEYIGVPMFFRQIEKMEPKFLSCVIQKNEGEAFVSESKYTNVFDGISKLHTDIDKEELIEAAQNGGFDLKLEKDYPLPNGKKFIRLDFNSLPPKSH